jgi:hypothetical protein
MPTSDMRRFRIETRLGSVTSGDVDRTAELAQVPLKHAWRRDRFRWQSAIDISKIDNPKPRRMGHGICAADRVELVDERADVKFGRVNRDAEALGNHLV